MFSDTESLIVDVYKEFSKKKGRYCRDFQELYRSLKMIHKCLRKSSGYMVLNLWII